jgi:hypothetical protein
MANTKFRSAVPHAEFPLLSPARFAHDLSLTGERPTVRAARVENNSPPDPQTPIHLSRLGRGRRRWRQQSLYLILGTRGGHASSEIMEPQSRQHDDGADHADDQHIANVMTVTPSRTSVVFLTMRGGSLPIGDSPLFSATAASGLYSSQQDQDDNDHQDQSQSA